MAASGRNYTGIEVDTTPRLPYTSAAREGRPLIDLHAHILPGVDDGVRTLDESVELAAAAARDGVHTIAATPHQTVWPGERSREAVLARVEAVAQAVAAAGVDLQVVAGMEAYVDLDLPRQLDRVQPLAGGPYLLVELPMQHFPNYAEQVLFELQLRGYLPILAHPERNTAIQEDPSLLRRLVERGVLGQVTAGSLTGVFGTTVRETAFALLRSNLVHVIASDAHTPGGPRGPMLSEAVRAAAQVVGAAQASALVVDAPAAVLAGRPVRIEPPAEPPRRPFWRFWK